MSVQVVDRLFMFILLLSHDLQFCFGTATVTRVFRWRQAGVPFLYASSASFVEIFARNPVFLFSVV